MVDKNTWNEATEFVKVEVAKSAKSDTFRSCVIDILDLGFDTLYNVLNVIEQYKK